VIKIIVLIFITRVQWDPYWNSASHGTHIVSFKFYPIWSLLTKYVYLTFRVINISHGLVSNGTPIWNSASHGAHIVSFKLYRIWSLLTKYVYLTFRVINIGHGLVSNGTPIWNNVSAHIVSFKLYPIWSLLTCVGFFSVWTQGEVMKCPVSKHTYFIWVAQSHFFLYEHKVRSWNT